MEQEHKRRVRYKGTHPRNYREKYKELNPEKYQGDVEKIIKSGKTPAGMHISIMVDEILEFLDIQPGQIGYDAMLQRYQGSFGTFVGPTKILISSDTLQVRDYSRYSWTMFDPEHKKQRHETVFPEDKKKAFALGERMAKGTWEE